MEEPMFISLVPSLSMFLYRLDMFVEAGKLTKELLTDMKQELAGQLLYVEDCTKIAENFSLPIDSGNPGLDVMMGGMRDILTEYGDEFRKLPVPKEDTDEVPEGLLTLADLFAGKGEPIQVAERPWLHIPEWQISLFLVKLRDRLEAGTLDFAALDVLEADLAERLIDYETDEEIEYGTPVIDPVLLERTYAHNKMMREIWRERAALREKAREDAGL